MDRCYPVNAFSSDILYRGPRLSEQSPLRYLPSSSFSLLTDFIEIEHTQEVEYIFLVSYLIRNEQLNM